MKKSFHILGIVRGERERERGRNKKAESVIFGKINNIKLTLKIIKYVIL